MTLSLIGAGSNSGDRAATLDAAVAALGQAIDVQLLRQSAWQMTLPVGGHAGQNQFLNGAALVETSRSPQELLALLQQIESQFGRERHERWGDRTLDLDLLLYGDAVIDTPSLAVPHPRMSFRRFALEPSVEIAGGMLHPTIGWTLERLLHHLDAGANAVALVSSNDTTRQTVAADLLVQFEFELSNAPLDDPRRWPPASTTWLALQNQAPRAGEPKLTIQIGHEMPCVPGRGPTLQLTSYGTQDSESDVSAAIEAVWPRLGR